MSKWVKYRTLWACGPSSWEWVELSEHETDIKGSIKEITDHEDMNMLSDKYRGHEFVVHNVPPIEILDKELAKAISSRDSYTKKVERLIDLRKALTDK